MHDEEILGTVKLFPTSVRRVLKAHERLARANRAPCYVGNGVRGVDSVFFSQGVTKTPYCETVFLRDAQNLGYFVKCRVVEARVDILVGAVKQP